MMPPIPTTIDQAAQVIYHALPTNRKRRQAAYRYADRTRATAEEADLLAYLSQERNTK